MHHPLFAFSALARPAPALACWGACPTGLYAFAPLLLVGGGFVPFVFGKALVGTLS